MARRRFILSRSQLLFTADIGYATEWDLIDARLVSDVTLLKVAHHGSAASSSAEFLAVTRPEMAVISAGADNRFGHPAPATLARLETVTPYIYRTDLDSSVEVITDGKKLWVRTER